MSTLTGTQVLLLVVSETGLVYTFTTPKLQPLVTKSEGKNLIQSCLNAPDPIESSNPSSMDHHQQHQPPTLDLSCPPMYRHPHPRLVQLTIIIKESSLSLSYKSLLSPPFFCIFLFVKKKHVIKYFLLPSDKQLQLLSFQSKCQF